MRPTRARRRMLAYALFEVPSGWLADRFGARLMLTRAFGRWLPARERGSAFGLTLMAAALGGAATQTLVAALLGRFSWRQALPIFGAVGLVYAAAWFAWFRDDPRAHRSVNAAELAAIGGGPPTARPAVPWGKLVRSRNLAALCAMYFGAIYAARAPERSSVAAWLAALLIATACVLFFRLGVPGIHNEPEQRCFEVERTMVASRVWWVPLLDGKPRINKPPLYYWASSGVARLLGEVGPTSLRLPAAVCALALVALTYAWGRAIGGPAHGLFAAMLLATMKCFVVLGRRGVAEMPLALFCTAALFSYERLRATRRSALLPVFALCLALAILAKATAALLIVGVPIAVDLGLRGELRAALRPRVVAWVAAAVAAGFAWYGVVLARVPQAWDVVIVALWLPLGVKSIVAANTTLHYQYSLLYYVPLLPSLALPGLLLLPLSLVRAWQTRLWREEPARRFPALAFAALLLAFSLLPQKQPHYLLPLLPVLALLLAEPLAHAVATRPEAVRRALRVLGPLAGVFGAVLLAAALSFYGGLIEAPAGFLAVLLGIGGAIIAGCMVAGARGRAIAFASWCTLGWLVATGIIRLDYAIHRDLRKHGELALRTDAGSRRWEHAFERLERLEEQWTEGAR